jgi:dienelactone hydrolase
MSEGLRVARRTALAVVIGSLLALGATGAAADPAPDPVDCKGPPAAAAPGTPAWYQREAQEAWCGEQRARDTASNPLFHVAGAETVVDNRAVVKEDPMRDPGQLAGKRFRYEKVSIPDPADGRTLSGYLFRPCDHSCSDMPAGLRRFEPPYPAVVVAHGGSADQEMYWWGVEPLAEDGYMVLTFQVPTDQNTGSDAFFGDTSAALDFLTSGANPHRTELDARHIGLAGHSAGGVAVSQIGQTDPRVSAVVSWDRAQSSPLPSNIPLRTPTMFQTADYNCQQVPVCVPQPYTSPPDYLGPGNKDQDFRLLRSAGVDTMKVSLRAATHLDYTQFGLAGTGSRYGAAVAEYYTLAWFDKYLRGATRRDVATDALRRLTATTFDDSEDVHDISSGQFDPATAANVPPMLSGQPVLDRLSFHFRSGYWLDGGAEQCDDIRAGCPAPGG